MLAHAEATHSIAESIANEMLDLKDMTISEVLSHCPDDVQWKITDTHSAKVSTDGGLRGVIYWDTQDADNIGWAYDLRDADGREMSGELDTVADLINVLA